MFFFYFTKLISSVSSTTNKINSPWNHNQYVSPKFLKFLYRSNQTTQELNLCLLERVGFHLQKKLSDSNHSKINLKTCHRFLSSLQRWYLTSFVSHTVIASNRILPIRNVILWTDIRIKFCYTRKLSLWLRTSYETNMLKFEWFNNYSIFIRVTDSLTVIFSSNHLNCTEQLKRNARSIIS